MAPGDAHEYALRALRRRDLSVQELETRLAERGFDEDERGATIDTLLRTGLLDDARFAEARAQSLARRGSGDALIRHDLGAAGVDPDVAEGALAVLEPEPDRVRVIVEKRGVSAATARYLSSKGFAPEVVASVAASNDRELG